jgi:hypothetical protein
MAHLMRTILGSTADLNHALQKKDEDIVNAVELVSLTKLPMHQLRQDVGWEDFLKMWTHFVLIIKSKFQIWTHSTGM